MSTEEHDHQIEEEAVEEVLFEQFDYFIIFANSVSQGAAQEAWVKQSNKHWMIHIPVPLLLRARLDRPTVRASAGQWPRAKLIVVAWEVLSNGRPSI